MALVFQEAAHRYELEGAFCPGVTSVLEASGLIDFNALPLFVRLTALERGRLVHQAIHYFNEGDLDADAFISDHPDLAPYVEGWIAFCTERRPTPWLCEYRVASRRHHYAGTIDYLGELDGEGVLLDFATGDPNDVGKNLQTAGYLGAAMEWQHEPGEVRLREFFARFKFIRRFAVRLTKTGTFRMERYDEPTDYQEFLALHSARRVVAKYRGEWDAWLKGAA